MGFLGLSRKKASRAAFCSVREHLQALWMLGIHTLLLNAAIVIPVYYFEKEAGAITGSTQNVHFYNMKMD